MKKLEAAHSLSGSEERLLRKYPQIAEALRRSGKPSLDSGDWKDEPSPLLKAVQIVHNAELVSYGILRPGDVFVGAALAKSDMEGVIKAQERIIASELGEAAARELVRDLANAVSEARVAATGGLGR